AADRLSARLRRAVELVLPRLLAEDAAALLEGDLALCERVRRVHSAVARIEGERELVGEGLRRIRARRARHGLDGARGRRTQRVAELRDAVWNERLEQRLRRPGPARTARVAAVVAAPGQRE